MPRSMRIAVLTGPRRVELRTVPVPVPRDNMVLVRTDLCGICGSDVQFWLGSVARDFPYAPGHEFCGTVEQAGRDVRGVDPGGRVIANPNLGCGACPYCGAGKPNLCDELKTRPVKSNGGLSEFVALDARMIRAMPPELPVGLAPFVEPLSCALHAVRLSGAAAGEKLAVFGAGTMGVLVALAAQDRESEVVVVEPRPGRRKEAAGVTGLPALSPDQLDESPWKHGLDAVIDCSGRIEAARQAIDSLRKGGRLVLCGLATDQTQESVSLIDVTRKELTVRGAWLNPGTFEEAIETAVRYRRSLARLSTEVFPLADAAAAFERASEQKVNKVLVRP
ncbi:zinc-binding dehydrogenase [Verrucomicrobiota bacterium]